MAPPLGELACAARLRGYQWRDPHESHSYRSPLSHGVSAVTALPQGEPRGTHILLHPLSFYGKGVAGMTISELYEFCLVLIGLVNLVIQIIEINKKK